MSKQTASTLDERRENTTLGKKDEGTQGRGKGKTPVATAGLLCWQVNAMAKKKERYSERGVTVGYIQYK